MSAGSDFIVYIIELLEPVAAIEGGTFFGGYGIKALNRFHTRPKKANDGSNGIMKYPPAYWKNNRHY